MMSSCFDLPENSPQQLDKSNMIGRVNELEDMKSKLMDISSSPTCLPIIHKGLSRDQLVFFIGIKRKERREKH